MPSFGAIKVLQQRTGADRATCKRALELNDEDEERAAAWVAEQTGVPDARIEKAKEEAARMEHQAEHGTAMPPGTVSVVRQEVGDGETFPQQGDILTMHYRGTLASDESWTDTFDSSHARGKPFEFKVGKGKVIKGWDVGVPKMSLGEKALLFISADYAYGAQGAPPKIPPNADLKFEVELLKVTRAAAQRDGRNNQEYDNVARSLLGQAGHQAACGTDCC